MFGIGPEELLVIMLVVLVLFGGKKIPEVMRGLGQGLREFRSVTSQATSDIKKLVELEDEPEKPTKIT